MEKSTIIELSIIFIVLIWLGIVTYKFLKSDRVKSWNIPLILLGGGLVFWGTFRGLWNIIGQQATMMIIIPLGIIWGSYCAYWIILKHKKQ